MRKRAPAAARRRTPQPVPAVKALSGLEQVRALSHPLRVRLVEVFGEQPRTTKQAAGVLGQPPTRLYHHVAALERAGLIRLRETRPNRGTIEKYYEVAARRFELRDMPRGAKRAQAARDVATMGMVVFDQARDELVRALARPRAGTRPVMAAMRAVLRLSEHEARTLLRDLVALVRRARARAAARGKAAGSTTSRAKRQRYSITIALLPTAPEPADV